MTTSDASPTQAHARTDREVTLRERTADFAVLDDWIAEYEDAMLESGGVEDEERLAALKALIAECQGKFEAKMEAIAARLKLLGRYESLALAEKRVHRDAADQMDRRASMWLRAQEDLKALAMWCFDEANATPRLNPLTKVKSALHTIYIQNEGERAQCLLTDQQLIEAHDTDHPLAPFIRLHVEARIDLDALKQEMQASRAALQEQDYTPAEIDKTMTEFYPGARLVRGRHVRVR